MFSKSSLFLKCLMYLGLLSQFALISGKGEGGLGYLYMRIGRDARHRRDSVRGKCAEMLDG